MTPGIPAESPTPPIARAIGGGFHCQRGRTALRAILQAIDLKPGDEVILQAYTCLGVVLPILSVGARPIFVDISPETLSMDSRGLEAAVSPRTRAVVVQHTFGIPASMDELMAAAAGPRITVIEDCCHSILSTYRGRPIGGIGHAAFYSYEWGKPLVLGGGGSAVANTPALEDGLSRVYSGYSTPQDPLALGRTVLKTLRRRLLTPTRYWQARACFRAIGGAAVVLRTFQPTELDGVMSCADTRMPSGLVVSLAEELGRLDEDRHLRSRLGALYRQGLRALGALPESPRLDEGTVLLRYPLPAVRKQELLRRARSRSIEIGDWFTSPVHPLAADRWSRVGYKAGSCPNAEEAAGRIVTLPIYRGVSEEDALRAIDFLGEMRRDGLL